MQKSRMLRLAERQLSSGLDCVALVPGPNLRYLSGLTLFMSERPIVAFFPLGGRPAVVLPLLEKGRAAAMAGENIELYPYSDDEGPASAFAQAAQALGLDGKRCAVEHLHMRVLELRFLEAAAPGVCIVSLEEALPGLRLIKDAQEVEAMRGAIEITEQGLRSLISRPLIGLTERQIADRLAQELMRTGADRIAFVIVVSGPNGADPHRGPSDRQTCAGELLTIDCGVYHDGYLSDITRTFALGEVGGALVKMYSVVQYANAEGKAAIRPGVTAQQVDRAARQVIAVAGYGEYFIHRTGHGLGIETHEPPYIVEGNTLPLEPGMAFTVEPGVYVPGVGGVRIEDDVVVREGGSECLTTFPRELQFIS